MPGNPLPKLTMSAERWPYDPEGPVNGKWGEVEVTAAPKAVFDAASGVPSLGYSSGHVRVLNGDQYEVVTAPDGEQAFNYAVNGNASAYGDATLEIKFRILVDTFKTYHHFKWRQPDNFYHRKCVATNGDISEVSDWIKGDEVVTSGGNTATFYSVDFNSGDGGDVVVFENFTGQWEVNWTGVTITNSRTGGTFTTTDSHLIGANNKLFHEWVDGEYGYSNGGLKIEYDAAGNGNSKIKPNRSASYRDGVFFGPGNLGNQAPGMAGDEVIFDRDDNGYDIEFVIGRVHSSAIDKPDGAMYLWKKSHRPESPYAEWKLLFKSEGFVVWGDNSEGTPNAPTQGYHFGAANSGYESDTAWLIKFWHYWTQKPPFLP